MTLAMQDFLIALKALLAQHSAQLTYMNNDDGIHAIISDEDVCIGFSPKDMDLTIEETS